MSQLTTPAAVMADQLKGVFLTEEDREVLIFAAERGLIHPDAMHPSEYACPQLLDLLQTSGARRAWDADQDARAVPLDCPSWCAGMHGRIVRDGQLTDELDTLLRPFSRPWRWPRCGSPRSRRAASSRSGRIGFARPPSGLLDPCSHRARSSHCRLHLSPRPRDVRGFGTDVDHEDVAI